MLEEEAIDLHVIGMTSKPPIFYWKPATLAVLEAVRLLRRDGVEAAATMDAGANVHVICTPAAEETVAAAAGRGARGRGSAARPGRRGAECGSQDHLL